MLVAKELCPKANSEEGKKKTRYLSRSVQAMKDQFRSYDFNRISNRGENELVFSNPKVKSIDDILTLERKISTKCRKSPTIDDGNRDIANVLMQLSYRSTDMDNNEAANVLASIANISDENTEDLDRRISYLQNLNTNKYNANE